MNDDQLSVVRAEQNQAYNDLIVSPMNGPFETVYLDFLYSLVARNKWSDDAFRCRYTTDAQLNLKQAGLRLP